LGLSLGRGSEEASTFDMYRKYYDKFILQFGNFKYSKKKN